MEIKGIGRVIENVGRERFCPQQKRVTPWFEKSSADRCAECGELVSYNRTTGEGPVRLVCIECLVKDGPPYEPVLVHGGDPWHCLDCWDRMRPSGNLPRSWWGA